MAVGIKDFYKFFIFPHQPPVFSCISYVREITNAADRTPSYNSWSVTSPHQARIPECPVAKKMRMGPVHQRSGFHTQKRYGLGAYPGERTGRPYTQITKAGIC
jgi:hypothetical protein